MMRAMMDSKAFLIERRRAVLRLRARSFYNEGYLPLVNHDSEQLFLAKLRHRSNGKIIIIRGYPIENKYTQVSDGKPIINQSAIL